MALTPNNINNIAQGVGTAKAAIDLYKAFTKKSTPPFKNAPIIKFEGTQDYRAKLIIPGTHISENYAAMFGNNRVISNAGGIIFPYTPTITYEQSAAYSTLNVMHSNFPLYFYKNSSISTINLNAKFTVQNDLDAGFYLSVSNILKTLTKMRTVNDGTDQAGAPPPVCRLSAYGDYMLKNIPVALMSFKIDLSDTVDYYRSDPTSEGPSSMFGQNFIPTVSTISMVFAPMYSRSQQMKYSITDFAMGKLDGLGYL
jgi:hypothetical protein